jgi:hypothetical protein
MWIDTYKPEDDVKLLALVNDTLMMRAYHTAVLGANGDTMAVFHAPMLEPGIPQRPMRERKN